MENIFEDLIIGNVERTVVSEDDEGLSPDEECSPVECSLEEASPVECSLEERSALEQASPVVEDSPEDDDEESDDEDDDEEDDEDDDVKEESKVEVKQDIDFNSLDLFPTLSAAGPLKSKPVWGIHTLMYTQYLFLFVFMLLIYLYIHTIHM